MTFRGNRRRLAALLGSVALLAVTACQSSSDEASEPAAGASSSSSSSSSPTAVPTSETPTVEPADGKRIRVPGATMRGLSTYKRYANYGIVQGYGDGQSSLSLSSNLTTATSLDGYARGFARDLGRKPKAIKRLDNVVVGGSYNAWHQVDTSEKLADVHYFGVMYLDGAWLIKISNDNGAADVPLTDEEFQEVVDSLLATFEVDGA